MIFRSLLAALFLFVTPALADPLIIDDNMGGGVETFVYWYNLVKASHTPVVLRGMCVSACTYILSLPKKQVCVEPTASLGFHLVTSDGEPDPEFTKAMIVRYYPPAVQKWLENRVLTTDVIFMLAPEIISLGIFPPC